MSFRMTIIKMACLCRNVMSFLLDIAIIRVDVTAFGLTTFGLTAFFLTASCMTASGVTTSGVTAFGVTAFGVTACMIAFDITGFGVEVSIRNVQGNRSVKLKQRQVGYLMSLDRKGWY